MAKSTASTLRAAKRAIEAETKRQLDEQANDALRHLRSRTIRGIGINDRKFEPYRPSVAKRKGRSAPVSLQEKNNMLGSLYVRPGSKGRREIIFRDRSQERIGRFHQFGTRNRNGSKRMAARRWFGVTLRYSRESFQKFARAMEVAIPTDRRKSFKISLIV